MVAEKVCGSRLAEARRVLAEVEEVGGGRWRREKEYG